MPEHIRAHLRAKPPAPPRLRTNNFGARKLLILLFAATTCSCFVTHVLAMIALLVLMRLLSALNASFLSRFA